MTHSTNGFFYMLMASIRMARDRRAQLIAEGASAAHRWYTVGQNPYAANTIDAEWWMEGFLSTHVETENHRRAG